MKINYNNTALRLLDKMDPTQFRMIGTGQESDLQTIYRLGHSVVKVWPNFVSGFKSSIQYISEPFYKAYERSAHKLASVLDAEPIDVSGTFIFRANPSEVNTIFYRVKTTGKEKDFDMDFTAFIFNNHTSKDKPALGIVCQRRPSMKPSEARFYASKAAQEHDVSATSVMADIFSLVLFLKYCEVETKIIPPGRKANHVGNKYVNETKSEIKILDSTWFTTIIKGEGFGVTGHFKMQPYGPGLTQRKLIYVQAYEKEGYTRTAKVLTTNTNIHGKQ